MSALGLGLGLGLGVTGAVVIAGCLIYYCCCCRNRTNHLNNISAENPRTIIIRDDELDNQFQQNNNNYTNELNATTVRNSRTAIIRNEKLDDQFQQDNSYNRSITNQTYRIEHEVDVPYTITATTNGGIRHESASSRIQVDASPGGSERKTLISMRRSFLHHPALCNDDESSSTRSCEVSLETSSRKDLTSQITYAREIISARKPSITSRSRRRRAESIRKSITRKSVVLDDQIRVIPIKPQRRSSIPSVDLHGLTLYEARVITKNFLKAKSKTHERVKIITGRGLHSDGGIPVIKPNIIHMLDNMNLDYTLINRGGCLLVEV